MQGTSLTIFFVKAFGSGLFLLLLETVLRVFLVLSQANTSKAYSKKYVVRVL